MTSGNKNKQSNGKKVNKYYERKKAYKDKQTFWFIVLTVLILFALCAVIIFAKDAVDRSNSNSKTQTTKELISEITTQEIVGGELLQDQIPEVNKVVQSYFDAKNKADEKALKKVVDKVSKSDLNEIENEQDNVDKYSGISVYTKKGMTDNAYVAYVYFELKFKNIDTSAPGIVVLYVMKNTDDNTWFIHNFTDDSQVTQYIGALEKESDVQNLYATVDAKLIAACDSDSKLKELYKSITSVE